MLVVFGLRPFRCARGDVRDVHECGRVAPPKPKLSVLVMRFSVQEEERVARVRRRRAGLPEELPLPSKRQVSQEQELEEAILAEIDDRRRHLEEMERLGAASQKQRQVMITLSAVSSFTTIDVHHSAVGNA